MYLKEKLNVVDAVAHVALVLLQRQRVVSTNTIPVAIKEGKRTSTE
ncbi:hypothetical protein BN2127_JRS3_03494 [Bacillus safensis]|nr:hypothetical protein BN2127_JRS3_03494 [Bacillus safensis]